MQKDCSIKIIKERRAGINNQFWKMTTKEQKTYIVNYTEGSTTKRNTGGHE